MSNTCIQASLKHNRISQRSNTLNLDLDNIAVSQERLWLSEETHSSRRASHDCGTRWDSGGYPSQSAIRYVNTDTDLDSYG